MENWKITMRTLCVAVLYLFVVVGSGATQKSFTREKRHVDFPYTSCRSMNLYPCISLPYWNRRQVCISLEQMCDGRCDCPLADDERFCDLITLNPTVTLTLSTTVTMVTTSLSSVTLPLDVTLNSTASVVASVTRTVLTGLGLSFYTTNPTPGEELCTVVGTPVINENHYVVATVEGPVEESYSTSVVCGPTVLYP